MKRLFLGLAALVLFAGVADAQLAPPPLVVHELALSGGTKTATAVAGAATLSKSAGVVTSEALTTAAGGIYTLTLTNANVAAADQVFAGVANGTNTTGLPDILTVTPGAGTVVIVVGNVSTTAAFNGTVKISFMVLKN